MLRYGFHHRDRREIVGQLIRLVLAGPASLTGRYPIGNTGGARISTLSVLPIPDNLSATIRAAS